MPGAQPKNHLDEIYVDAYYTPVTGPVQMFNMFIIDFEEAKAARPHEWFLEPPPGGEVVNMSENKKMVVSAAPLIDATPLTTAQVQRKVRTGVAGAP